jgi:uncharacterized membrane protein
MEETTKKPAHRLRQKIGAQFIEGLLVIVPIAIAFWILKEIISFIDRTVQPLVPLIFGPNFHIPLAGFALTLVLIYVVGLLTESVFIRRGIHFGESQLARVPVFRYFYIGIKNLLERFSKTGSGGGFTQVVLVEFPSKGMWALGFVTGEITTASGEKMLSVFVPHSPTPTSGFIEIVKEKDVVRLDIPIDEALQMILSAGAFVPAELKAKLK